MRHIGEVIKAISIPINTGTGAISTDREAVSCPICKDAGYLRMDVPLGHPNFGRIFPCQCTVERREARMVGDLRKLSNLDAFADRTFESFDASIDGVEDA